MRMNESTSTFITRTWTSTGTNVLFRFYHDKTDCTSLSFTFFWWAYMDRISFGLAEGKLKSTDLERGPRAR